MSDETKSETQVALKPLSERQVTQALRLYMGRVLCDECGMEQGDAMDFILDHEADLPMEMKDAIERFWMQENQDEDEDESIYTHMYVDKEADEDEDDSD
jgi:hypothetical protein